MTTLTGVVEALTATLQAALPGVFVHCEPPPDGQRSIVTPAVYVDLVGLDPIGNQGDGRVVACAALHVRVVIDSVIDRAYRHVRELSARVIVALHGSLRPVPGHGHVQVLTAGEADFAPELEGYLAWDIEAQIDVALGELEPVAPPAPSVVIVGASSDGAPAEPEQLVP